jgi:sugar phosphate isomerase/epimerase
MEIGIGIFGGIDFGVQAELFRKHGVKRTFVMSELPGIEGIIENFQKNGIILDTLHAPFDKINDMWSPDDKAAQKMLDRLENGVDLCAKYNIPVLIVHLSSKTPMPEITDVGVERFDRLFEYAKEKRVKIALENQRFRENLEYFLDRNSELGFCWDTGHENCFTQRINFMELFGEKLCALHIHDNRCLPDKDDNMLPFDGNIDFDKVASFIAQSGYEGTVMLEVGKNVTKDGESVYGGISDEEYVLRAIESANRLLEMINSKR